MEQIKRIQIENVKGKQFLECKFEDCIGNMPNIIVAPNGYGKSTIAKAFASLKPSRLELDKEDEYGKDAEKYQPKLIIDMVGTVSGIFQADPLKNELYKKLDVMVINSSLYAKSTTKMFPGGSRFGSADLRMKDIVVFERIPSKVTFNYSFSNIRKNCKVSHLLQNMSPVFNDLYNLKCLELHKETISRCLKNKTENEKMENFINSVSSYKGSQRCSIPPYYVQEVMTNAYINELATLMKEFAGASANWYDVDSILGVYQLWKWIESSNLTVSNFFTALIEYKTYEVTVNKLKNRLDEFNTTGRKLTTHENHGKLVVKFDRAESMSNGERDILSFIVQLVKFEVKFTKQCGILIIDEVFDYLDGCNMLAVQYYLGNFIKDCKKRNKVLFPIIMTHLDPGLFSNYYFPKIKKHYISVAAHNINKSDAIVLVEGRNKLGKNSQGYNEISGYFLHYSDQVHVLSSTVGSVINYTGSGNNVVFRSKIYKHVTDKYLKGLNYNPIDVVLGVRLKIEERVFNNLKSSDRAGFLGIKKTKDKLDYADAHGVNIPEVYYLLQLLYNDALHWKDENSLKFKSKSCVLKLDNIHIHKMVEKVFM